MSTKVQVRSHDRTLVILITRPDVRNAIDQGVADGIAGALDQLDEEDGCTVGVIAGVGGTFSSGMDLKAFSRGEPCATPKRGFAGIVERPPDKPLIAAVEGYALGGGFEIVLSCDLVVAARDATFGLPEVTRGLIASGGALLRLPRRIPRNVASEAALTGGQIGAERAYELGLVNRLVPPGRALETAVELAATIATNAPLAVRVSKQIMTESADWSASEMFERQQPFRTIVMASRDAKEGAAAFVEKRVPVWSGTSPDSSSHPDGSRGSK
jgi:enoyl-CoA hydratase